MRVCVIRWRLRARAVLLWRRVMSERRRRAAAFAFSSWRHFCAVRASANILCVASRRYILRRTLAVMRMTMLVRNRNQNIADTLAHSVSSRRMRQVWADWRLCFVCMRASCVCNVYRCLSAYHVSVLFLPCDSFSLRCGSSINAHLANTQWRDGTAMPKCVSQFAGNYVL